MFIPGVNDLDRPLVCSGGNAASPVGCGLAVNTCRASLGLFVPQRQLVRSIHKNQLHESSQFLPQRSSPSLITECSVVHCPEWG